MSSTSEQEDNRGKNDIIFMPSGLTGGILIFALSLNGDDKN